MSAPQLSIRLLHTWSQLKIVVLQVPPLFQWVHASSHSNSSAGFILIQDLFGGVDLLHAGSHTNSSKGFSDQTCMARALSYLLEGAEQGHVRWRTCDEFMGEVRSTANYILCCILYNMLRISVFGSCDGQWWFIAI